VSVGKLDFVRNNARLRIYFDNSLNGHLQNGDESSGGDGDD
jgi:hypothetical protein